MKSSIFTNNMTLICRESNRDAYRVKYALKSQERKDLIQDCGLNGLVLFEYYLRMASIPNAAITDKEAAEYFGWSEFTASRWRRNLIKKGWYYAELLRGDRTNGRVMVYHLGKEAVSLVLKTTKSSSE